MQRANRDIDFFNILTQVRLKRLGSASLKFAGRKYLNAWTQASFQGSILTQDRIDSLWKQNFLVL